MAFDPQGFVARTVSSRAEGTGNSFAFLPAAAAAGDHHLRWGAGVA